MVPHDIDIEGITMKKTIQILNNIPLYIAAVGLVAAITIMVINVITRYIFNFTVAGYEEIIVICFSHTVFFGSAYAFYEGMHYGVDAIVNKLPPALKEFFVILKNLIIIVVCAYVAKLALSLANKAWIRLMPATNIPYFYFDIPVFFSFALMAVYAVVDLVKEIRRMTGKQAPVDETAD